MKTGTILGILIWLAGALSTLGFIYTIRRNELRGTGSTKVNVNIAMLWSVSLILIPVLDMSPFHLLWLFPASCAIGFLSLVFPFSLLSIPGRMFRNLCCIGIDWQEATKNRQKFERFTGSSADRISSEEVIRRIEQGGSLFESKNIVAPKRITYMPGAYSQILLPDGKRVFVQVRPTAITVRHQILSGFLPGRILWSFDVPFLIREIGPAGEPGASMMEVVLQALESCKSLNDVAPNLEGIAKPQLLLIAKRSGLSQYD